MAADILQLKHEAFEKLIPSSVRGLRNDKTFEDITLVSDEGIQQSAHEWILASSCVFFKNVFTNSQHPRPLIYL